MKKVVAMLMLVGVSLFSVGVFADGVASSDATVLNCVPGGNC